MKAQVHGIVFKANFVVFLIFVVLKSICLVLPKCRDPFHHLVIRVKQVGLPDIFLYDFKNKNADTKLPIVYIVLVAAYVYLPF